MSGGYVAAMGHDLHGARRDDLARALLARPPRPLRDPGRVLPSSGMARLVPARGPAPSDEVVVAGLERFLEVHLAGNRARIDQTLARYRAPEAVGRVPDPAVRAGLLALTGTLGDLLVEAFLSGVLGVTSLGFGVPADPRRVVGPPVGGPTGHHVVNERYRAEPFALFAPSLVHDLLHHEPAAADPDETLAFGLAAAVHLQLLSRSPELAGPTELARRQSSLALALLESRAPGSASVALVLPESPARWSAPGDAGRTRGFWSIPFLPERPQPAPATRALARLLDDLWCGGADAAPGGLVDEHLAEAIDRRVLARELRPAELVEAGVALTVFDAPAGRPVTS